MTEEHKELMIEEIKKVIKETVNGKIDRLTTTLAEHIVEHKADTESLKMILTDVAPIIQEFKEQKIVSERDKQRGEKLVYYGKIVTASIGIVVAIKLGIIWLISYKP